MSDGLDWRDGTNWLENDLVLLLGNDWLDNSLLLLLLDAQSLDLCLVDEERGEQLFVVTVIAHYLLKLGYLLICVHFLVLYTFVLFVQVLNDRHTLLVRQSQSFDFPEFLCLCPIFLLEAFSLSYFFLEFTLLFAPLLFPQLGIDHLELLIEFFLHLQLPLQNL